MRFNEWVENRIVYEIAVALAAEDFGEVFLERTEAIDKVVHAAQFLGMGGEEEKTAKNYIAKQVYPVIHKTAEYYLWPDTSLADDVAQETFLYVLRKMEKDPDKIRDYPSIKRWLRGITKKVAVRKKRDDMTQILPPPFVVNRDATGQKIPAEKVRTAGFAASRRLPNYFIQHRIPKPEEELYSQEEKDVVHSGLEMLEKQPGGREKAAMLRKMYGLGTTPRTMQQIAKETGRNTSGVATRVGKSYDFLRRILQSRGVDFSDRGLKKQGRGIAGGTRTKPIGLRYTRLPSP